MDRSRWTTPFLYIFIALVFAVMLFYPLRFVLAEEANEIIRIHFFANSDSAYDQAIKLAVRDQFWRQHGRDLHESMEQGSAAVMRYLKQNLAQIAHDAQQTAEKAGYNGKVHTEVGRLFFPERLLNEHLFSEGFYPGLKISIGSGRGKNWWCVLYPELTHQLSILSEPMSENVCWYAKCIFSHWLIQPE